MTEKIMCGFHSIFESFEDDEEKWAIGYGLNEGVTQYLTKKRNKLRGINRELGYPLLTMEVENLIQITGEDDILECFFNEPMALPDVIESHNMNYYSMLSSFDTIHRNERKLIKYRRIFGATFGELENDDNEYQIIGADVSSLNITMMQGIGEINSIEQFERLADFVRALKVQNFALDKNEVFHYLLEKRDRLINDFGYDEKTIGRIIESRGLEEDVEFQRKAEELIVEDKNELAIKLYKLEEEDVNFFDKILTQTTYKDLYKKYLYPNGHTSEWFEDMIIIARLLDKYPEIDFDDVTINSLECDDLDYYIRILQTSDGRSFFTKGEGEDGFFEINKNEKNIIPDFIGNSDEKSSLEIIYENGDFTFYKMINGERKKLEVENLDTVPSNLDRIRERVEKGLERVDRLKKLQAPQLVIIEVSMQTVQKNMQEISDMETRINKRKEKHQSQSKLQVSEMDNLAQKSEEEQPQVSKKDTLTKKGEEEQETDEER